MQQNNSIYRLDSGPSSFCVRVRVCRCQTNNHADADKCCWRYGTSCPVDINLLFMLPPAIRYVTYAERTKYERRASVLPPKHLTSFITRTPSGNHTPGSRSYSLTLLGRFSLHSPSCIFKGCPYSCGQVAYSSFQLMHIT